MQKARMTSIKTAGRSSSLSVFEKLDPEAQRKEKELAMQEN